MHNFAAENEDVSRNLISGLNYYLILDDAPFFPMMDVKTEENSLR